MSGLEIVSTRIKKKKTRTSEDLSFGFSLPGFGLLDL